jgi:erythronate-4-phosphate dehydrogenase
MVIAYDPLLNEAEKAQLAVASWPDLSTLLSAADIVCLHTPLTRDGPAPSYHLLNAEHLALLKPSAWLINAGRGDVIAADALAAYLLQPRAAAVLLDVLPNEPVPSLNIIAGCQQVSPHIAGHSLEGKWRGTWQITAKAAETFNCEQVGELTDIIPRQSPPVLVWPSASSQALVAPYAALLAQVVDCAGDDQRLRTALTDHPSEASAFDDLRKHYAPRREIAAHSIHGVPAGTSAQQLLTALGFCC